MFRPRIIPVLLLNEGQLVKSASFKNFRYIGDPLNAVRIFNELKADELMFLDVSATRNGRIIAPELVRDIGEEASMPFSVGGGITSLAQIRELVTAGAEKIVVGSHAALNPSFIRKASDAFGSSTITVCMDVKRSFFGKEQVYIKNGTQSTGFAPLDFATLMEKNGAGEIVVQSIAHDGMMKGYDLELIKKIASAVQIPTVALGGAGALSDLKKAYWNAGATGVAAGSLFVYYNNQKGVLINYPQTKDSDFFKENE